MMSIKRLARGLGKVALATILPLAATAALAQGDDAKITADAHKALDSDKFSNVTIAVHGGNAILTGSVADYAAKEEADSKLHHVHGVHGVDNEIQVNGGGHVEDTALRDKLARELSEYRVGYGTNAFNALTLNVQNGVVTLGGTVYGPTDKSEALSLVSRTAGVRDVVDNIKVAPLSPMDDELRIRLARAIYGSSELQRYALDPANPIRITVVNGNVTLSGVVDSKMDRDIAGIKANGVPGVFKVTNQIEVASSNSKGR
jgi:osmotically-inducible protein OsmY